MSTKIHKIMGYGAPITQHKDLFTVLHEGDDGEVERIMDGARLETEGKSNLALSFECKHPNWPGEYPSRFRHVVQFAEHPDCETGNLVFMTPVMFKSWFRYNSSLDYAEIAAQMLASENDGLETRILQHDSPFYPYLNWMDAETGDKVSMDVPNFHMRKTHGDKIAPFVPEAVRVISDHLTERGVVEEKFWLKLRPMIVTWWC